MSGLSAGVSAVSSDMCDGQHRATSECMISHMSVRKNEAEDKPSSIIGNMIIYLHLSTPAFKPIEQQLQKIEDILITCPVETITGSFISSREIGHLKSSGMTGDLCFIGLLSPSLASTCGLS